MEGLEISELKFSHVRLDNLHMRLDSEYFKKQYLNFFESIPNLAPLGDFVAEGYRVIYENTEILNESDGKASNYPYFLQAADLQTPFIKTDNLFYVHENDWLRYPKGQVKRGELLIEVKGKIEKVALVPDDFPEKTLVTGSLYKMSVNHKINKHYLLAYLICKYGVAFKDRYKTNLLISFVSKDDLYRIPVPNISQNFQAEIETIFLKLFKQQREAKYIYAKAETLLLDTLDMADFSPSTEGINVKSFKESFAATGRLDAEAYQPKYDQLRGVLESYSGGVTTIGKLAGQIANGAEVREYQEEGVAYLRVGDLKGLTIDDSSVVRIDPASAEKGLKKIDLQTGDVLVSRSGSLAVTAVVEPEWADALISSHLIRLRITDKRIDPYYLALFLGAMPGKMQIQQRSNGGVQPEINQPALKSILVPIPPSSAQLEIRRLILNARKLRDSSNALLDVAKRAVEITIERDEKTGMAYIVANT